MATSGLILESYLQSFDLAKMDTLRRNKMLENLLAYNKKVHSGDLLTPLNYYLGVLKNTDEVMFAYMSAEKKEQLLRDLQVTCLLLLAQKRYELTHQKYENKERYNQELIKCQQLIDRLNYTNSCEEQGIQPAPEYGYLTEEYPVKYLFIHFGQKFAEFMAKMPVVSTKSIQKYMDWFNDKRLYWVWGSSILLTILALLPADFFNTTSTMNKITGLGFYTGIASWALYYFRLSIHLSLLLKHTIAGPWMSEEEAKTPWTERLATQWSLRKLALGNYAFWATGNLLCFLLLIPKNGLGAWGDALTLGLLAFDIFQTVWEFEEQRTKFFQEMQGFDRDITIIKDLIHNYKDAESDDDKKLLKDWLLQLHALERSKKQCQRDWDHLNLGLTNNIAYAVGLMLAFAILTLPFLPLSGPAILAITVTGAVLCFAFTVIYNAVKSGLEIHKAYESKNEAKEDYKNKIAEFKELLAHNPELNDNEKKFLFLEIQKCMAETAYQKQMIIYQSMHFFRSVMMEALMPAIIFASFVFLPIGIGFAIMGAVLGLAIASNNLIEESYTPKKNSLKKFDEHEYNDFCANPDAWGKKSSTKDPHFFKATIERDLIDHSEDDQLLPDNGSSPP